MNNPELVRYSYLYNKNPHSRVFAPLADHYRKLGMYTDALDILKKGLRHHSDYTFAYIVLSRCHRDMGEFHRAYEVLSHIQNIESDNYAYKKLRAELAWKIDEIEVALKLYKELEELSPLEDFSLKIKELESRVEKENDSFYETKNYSVTQNATRVDDWVQMNFSKTTLTKDKLEDKVDTHPPKGLISHTLMNLYSEQGHYSKALQVANALLESDPTDNEVKLLRDEIIQKKLFEKDIENFEEDDELSEDHMNERYRSFDSNLSSEDEPEKISELRDLLQNFQEKINLKSAKYRLKLDV